MDGRQMDDPRAGAKNADVHRRRGPLAACHNEACRSAACRNFARRHETGANCGRHDRATKHRASATALIRPARGDRRNPCAGLDRQVRSCDTQDRCCDPVARRAKTSCRRRTFALDDHRGSLLPGTIAIARRPRAVRAVCSRTVTVVAETFAARCVGSLLAALPRRIRLLVAEFPVLEARCRTSIAAIIVRTIAARRDTGAFRRRGLRAA